MFTRISHYAAFVGEKQDFPVSCVLDVDYLLDTSLNISCFDFYNLFPHQVFGKDPEKIFMFHITWPPHVKNPRPKNVSRLFGQIRFLVVNCCSSMLLSYTVLFYFTSRLLQKGERLGLSNKKSSNHGLRLGLNLADVTKLSPPIDLVLHCTALICLHSIYIQVVLPMIDVNRCDYFQIEIHAPRLIYILFPLPCCYIFEF